MRRIAILLALALPVFASEVVPGIHLIRGRFDQGTQPDGNTIIFKAPDGLIVVDTGRHAKHTQQIVDFAKIEQKPVVAIVNTHWHLDHIGGNAALRDAFPDVRIYASDALAAAREGFLAKYRQQLLNMPQNNAMARSELALIDSAPKLAPDEVIAESGTRSIAGRSLILTLEKGPVTAGDIWIRDAATGVIVAGDLVTLPAPFLDTADAKKWEAALERISKTDFELLIPGHGPPLTKRQFELYRKTFSALLACKDNCVTEWLDRIGPIIPPEEKEFTRMLMEYYVKLVQRKE
jgi:glyoxylase-like metal-dependent hydrolase (beta-lactamase superfamily II)